MRKLSVMCMAALLGASLTHHQPAASGIELADLAFISGCWEGQFGKDGSGTMEEIYTAPSKNLMLGTTRYLKEGAAVEYEFTRIERTDEGILLTPYPGGRASEHSFKLTSLEGGRAVFEAPEHDYPKRIIYAANDDGSRTARIDGGTDADAREWRLHSRPCPETSRASHVPGPGLIAIPNAKQPLDGILTGGQPSPEQMAQAARAGYRTVVNLRTDGEPGFEWEAARVSELGMTYVRIPVGGPAGFSRESARRLAEVLEDPASQPAMIHCATGNRVGALLALHAGWNQGASVEEALELGRRAGLTSAESTVRELLESGDPD